MIPHQSYERTPLNRAPVYDQALKVGEELQILPVRTDSLTFAALDGALIKNIQDRVDEAPIPYLHDSPTRLSLIGSYWVCDMVNQAYLYFVDRNGFYNVCPNTPDSVNELQNANYISISSGVSTPNRKYLSQVLGTERNKLLALGLTEQLKVEGRVVNEVLKKQGAEKLQMKFQEIKKIKQEAPVHRRLEITFGDIDLRYRNENIVSERIIKEEQTAQQRIILLRQMGLIR